MKKFISLFSIIFLVSCTNTNKTIFSEPPAHQRHATLHFEMREIRQPLVATVLFGPMHEASVVPLSINGRPVSPLHSLTNTHPFETFRLPPGDTLVFLEGKSDGYVRFTARIGENYYISSRNEQTSTTFTVRNAKGEVVEQRRFQGWINFAATHKLYIYSKPSLLTLALMEASMDGDEKGVARLLKEGADPNEKDENWLDAMIIAVRNGQQAIVRQFIHHRCNVNAQGYLAIAARHGEARIVDELLKAGAYPDLPDNLGYSPLMAAAARGHASIVKRLLEKQAYTATLSPQGKTAAELAEDAGFSSIAAIIKEAEDKTDF